MNNNLPVCQSSLRQYINKQGTDKTRRKEGTHVVPQMWHTQIYHWFPLPGIVLAYIDIYLLAVEQTREICYIMFSVTFKNSIFIFIFENMLVQKIQEERLLKSSGLLLLCKTKQKHMRNFSQTLGATWLLHHAFINFAFFAENLPKIKSSLA